MVWAAQREGSLLSDSRGAAQAVLISLSSTLDEGQHGQLVRLSKPTSALIDGQVAAVELQHRQITGGDVDRADGPRPRAV